LKNEIVTIKNQQDLEQFFENVSKEKTPKLILADPTPQSMMSVQTTPRSNTVTYSESGSPIMSSPIEQMSALPRSISSTKAKHVSKWAKGAFIGAGAFGKVFLGMNEGMCLKKCL